MISYNLIFWQSTPSLHSVKCKALDKQLDIFINFDDLRSQIHKNKS